MPEASSSPEVTKEILPEPRGCTGLLLLFLLLTTIGLEGGDWISRQDAVSPMTRGMWRGSQQHSRGCGGLRGANDP